jgi:hypothetical protein
MNAFIDGTAVQAVSRQLIREWSDPLALAHPQWLAGVPPELLDAAMTSPPGRQHLAAQLRRQVPLHRSWRAHDVERARWALRDRAGLREIVEHAGWLLMRSRVARVVVRSDIASIVARVGRSRYEAAFTAAPTLWHGDEPDRLPDLAGAAPDAVGVALRAVGWRALNQVLEGELAAIRSRLHLIAGPACARVRPRQHWPIDDAALLQALRAASEQPAVH